MSTKHTQGPWIAEHTNVFAPKAGSIFCVADCFGNGPDIMEAKANAAHIVRCVNAFPELVAALRDLIARASSLDQSATHDGLLNCQAITQARAALANATDTYPLPALAKSRA